MLEKRPDPVPTPDGFPNVVSILNYDFKIEYYNDLFRTEKSGDFCKGTVDNVELIIRLATKDGDCARSPRAMWKTLWHEIIHAVAVLLDINDCFKNSESEEHFVQSLSIGINDVFWQNRFQPPETKIEEETI
jgi:hypothetical protein